MTEEARRIARRYRLQSVLGRGAHGEVWRAHDVLADRAVAVKLVAPSFAAARVRREVAALRLLRLPGVVGLIDEGVDDEGAPFVVMELIEGAPFPARRILTKWSEIEDATLSLLDVLSRVHATGVVHRDLKPANVLVDAERRATLLDFGLCDGSLQTAGEDVGFVVGTPAYFAPEQIRGESATAATDLFAVGLMLHHALTGSPAHALDDLATLKRARLTTRAPAIRSRAPHVPPNVAEVIDAMLAVDANDRPQSAAEVLSRLSGSTPSPRSIAISSAISRVIREGKGLSSLFAGPDRILHLKEDAAAVLAARVDVEDGAAVEREVTTWVRAGLARWDGELLHVDRAAIERMQAMPRATVEASTRAERRAAHRALAASMSADDPARLMHLVAADAQEEIVDAALHLATSYAQRGRLESAAFVLEEAARAVRDDDRALSLLSLWAEIALVEGAARSLDRVLYAVCMRKTPSTKLAQLEALLRAALAVGTWTDRARALIEATPPFESAALERRRQAVRVFAAVRSSVEAEESLLRELEGWARAGSDEDRACLSGWLGRLRYRQGRFPDAARLHEDAAANERWITRRIAARINAASAWMEAFELEKAEKHARKGSALAAECRDAFFEAYAEQILHAIAVRSGETHGADWELVGVASSLGRGLEATITLTEAGAAYRARQTADALQLATRARAMFVSIGDPAAWMLASALCAATGGELPDLDEVRARVMSYGSLTIRLQVLGLLARAGKVFPLGEGDLERLQREKPRAVWSRPIDVLSIREALDALGVGA